ncbi:MAG: anti-sigma factor [Solirubrobacterales bacterium]
MNEIEHERWHEELSAYLLGALEPDEAEALEHHLESCERCREELRWLAPALDALPETVSRLQPPPRLRERLLTEVREDARRAAGASERRGILDRLRAAAGPHWRPLAAGAAVLLIVAAVVGYEVGNGGSEGGGGESRITVETEEPSGVLAAVSMEGTAHGRVELSNVPPLPHDKVLEAWVQRDGEVEAVPTLFVPNGEGHASTPIGDMRGVTTVMVTEEPPGGSKEPTEDPIATVTIAQ